MLCACFICAAGRWFATSGTWNLRSVVLKRLRFRCRCSQLGHHVPHVSESVCQSHTAHDSTPCWAEGGSLGRVHEVLQVGWQGCPSLIGGADLPLGFCRSAKSSSHSLCSELLLLMTKMKTCSILTVHNEEAASRFMSPSRQ